MVTTKPPPAVRSRTVLTVIVAPFRRSPDDKPLNRWVLWRIGLFGAIGFLTAVLMQCAPMMGSPRVFIEAWSEGIVLLTDTAGADLVDWFTASRSDAPYLEIGNDTLGTVYAALGPAPLANATLTGGGDVLVRRFSVRGACQIRIGFAQEPLTEQMQRRVEVIVQPADSGCTVAAELDPKTLSGASQDTGWSDIPEAAVILEPYVLDHSANAVLRFVPGALPLRTGRVSIQRVGFSRANQQDTTSLIHGGVMRLTTFMSDGEEEVRMLGRELGRGHPIHRGDRLQLDGLEDAEILQLEIGDLIHTQLTGRAPHPTIAGADKEPSLLSQINDQNQLLWVFGFALGLMAVVGAIIEAAR
jgi:hypothetical protein